MNQIFGLGTFLSVFLSLMPISLRLSAQSLGAQPDKTFRTPLNAQISDYHPLLGGKMLVVGSFTASGTLKSSGVARLMPNGAIDETFNLGKYSANGSGANGPVSCLLDCGDDNYLIGGKFTMYNGAGSALLVRFNGVYERDLSFRSPFEVTSANDCVTAVELCGQDGHMLIGGHFTKANGKKLGGIVRLDGSGSIDPTFNASGMDEQNAVILDLAVGGDGRSIAVGTFSRMNGVSRKHIACFRADGSLDSEFSAPVPDGIVRGIRFLADGRILIFGDFTHLGEHEVRNIAILKADGELDKSFKPYVFGTSGTTCRAAQAVGDAIYAGMGSTGLPLQKYLGKLRLDGSLDPDFYQGTGPDGNIASLCVTDDDKMYLSGDFENWNQIAVPQNIRLTLPSTKPEEDYNKFSYKTDFEDVEKDNYDEGIITVNGIRWKCTHVKVETDPLRNIPSGKKCISLRAFLDPMNPDNCTNFEMLDDVSDGIGRLSFKIVTSGQDGIFDPSGWTCEYSVDQGKTWKWVRFTAPARFLPKTGASISLDGKIVPTRLRFRYQGDFGQRGQRLLLDDLKCSRGDDERQVAMIQFDNLNDGFRTSRDNISFHISYLGDFGITNPQNPWPDKQFNSFLRIRLDGKDYKDLYALPFDPADHDYYETINNLARGEHTLQVEMMRLDGTSWKPEPLVSTVHFTVENYEKIQGIGELLRAEKGKFYEFEPRKKPGEVHSDSVYVNWISKYRAQKYIYDSQGGILIDDPLPYGYINKDFLEKVTVVEKMRGQLVEMDNTLMFRLDDKPILKETDENFGYGCRKIESFDTLSGLSEKGSWPVLLEKVHFDEESIDFAIQGNRFYKMFDRNGKSFPMYIAYPSLFVKAMPVIPSGEQDLWGISAKAFSDGQPCIIPLWIDKYVPDALSPAARQASATMRYMRGILHLKADGEAEAVLLDMEGRLLDRRTFTKASSYRINAISGSPLILLIRENGGHPQVFRFMAE